MLLCAPLHVISSIGSHDVSTAVAICLFEAVPPPQRQPCLNQRRSCVAEQQASLVRSDGWRDIPHQGAQSSCMLHPRG